ncbi:hypothetical protein [Thermus thalpophilus]|uniref:hypothetical protein n=1 Tax=Thermus thalpophilus TaxID=2908147 RepID=UPI001FAA15C5|nr:hypothetical protein [Thermus thalpophilus]
MKRLLWLLLLALAACSVPRGIGTTGNLRIQSVQPDVVAGCAVQAGDWMALKGNTFGTQAEWDAGINYALFPPNLPAESPEIIQASDPATLMFRVPAGAQSGLLRLHISGVGEAEIPVLVASATPQMAVPGCELPAPPQTPE